MKRKYYYNLGDIISLLICNILSVYKLIIYNFFLLSLFSCSEKKESLVEIYSLKKIDYHFLPIDNNTPVSTTNIKYIENDGQKFLYILNVPKQRIQVYNWNTKKLIKKIQLEKEGPNGVGEVNSFYIDNKDSLYVLSSYSYRLSLLNNKAKMLNQYILLEEGSKFDTLTLAIPRGGYSALAIGNSSNPLFKYNEYIITGAYPNLDFRTEKYFKESKTGLCLNTKTKKINYIMQYPKSYLNSFKNGYRFPGQYTWSSLAFNKEKNISIISYPADENLYITDMNTYKTTMHSAYSRFIDRIELPKKIATNPKEEFNFAISGDCYDAVYYDPYRKVYIRYALHPNQKKKDEFDDHPWLLLSIIVLDKDFNRMGESMLEENMPGGAIFFQKDGIYIQKYNPNVEDKLTFVRYEISKN